MNTRKLAGAGAATIGAVTAATALLLGTTAAVATESRPTSAYGFAATGLVPVSPVPYVEWRAGAPLREELLGIEDASLGGQFPLSIAVLTAEARERAAESDVAEVRIPRVLDLELVHTWCERGSGGLDVVNGTVFGERVPPSPVPSQEFDGSPLLTVSFNRQVRHDDGALTVTGVQIEVLPGAAGNLDRRLTAQEQAAVPGIGELMGEDLGGGAQTVGDVVEQLGGPSALPTSGAALQTVTIGSVTCAGPDRPKDDDEEDGEDDGGELPAAPRPEIVEHDLPVTG